jgi:hypothetical protein
MYRQAGAVVAIVLSGVVLAACADTSKPKLVDPNIYPKDFKQEILDTLTNTLEDPTNVRGAFLSDPVLTPVENDQRYTVCVRYNGRDANRQYKGSTDHIAYFFGGHLNQLVDATPEQCGKAAYKPFPELEKLCLAKKCM